MLNVRSLVTILQLLTKLLHLKMTTVDECK